MRMLIYHELSMQAVGHNWCMGNMIGLGAVLEMYRLRKSPIRMIWRIKRGSTLVLLCNDVDRLQRCSSCIVLYSRADRCVV